MPKLKLNDEQITARVRAFTHLIKLGQDAICDSEQHRQELNQVIHQVEELAVTWAHAQYADDMGQ